MELSKETLAIIAALGVLCGTIITNVITLIVHYWKERAELHKKRKELFRDKGEELYKLLLLKKEFTAQAHIQWVSVIDRQLTYNQMCELTAKHAVDNPENKNLSVKIDLLGGIYFPEIILMLDKAYEIVVGANDFYFKLHDVDSIKEPRKARAIILDSSEKYCKELDNILHKLAKVIQLKYV